jgi:hypothetical protein
MGLDVGLVENDTSRFDLQIGTLLQGKKYLARQSSMVNSASSGNENVPFFTIT